MRRDSQNIQDDDNFTLLLDTFYDRRNGYFMQTNALGALRDQQISDERNVNRDWNTVWDTKVGRDDKGYTVEMVIPFKSLRYKATGAQTWGINFRRIVRWKNEVSFLSAVPASLGTRAAYRFSSAATLVGIELPRQSRNFELKPYATSGMITNHQAVPALSNDLSGDLGVDGKYGLTKGLTADFTVNTDFAQVEDDDQQVNFTRNSLFFQEKREFFLEGQGIFAFGGVSPRPPGGDGDGNLPANNSAPPLTPVMFFSRQIGLSDGREVPIRGGARVTGRAGAYTLGLLNIQTGASEEAGAVATNFSAIRVRRDILRRSTIGLIGTYRPQRPGGAAGSNEVVGADATLAFFQNLTINTYYARSRTPGVTADDSSYLAKVDYTGDRYGLSAERLSVGEGFNPEIGFMRRRSFRRTFGLARFSPRPQSSPTFRKLIFEGSVDYITDRDGRLETRDVTGTFQIDLQSGDQWSNDIVRTYEFLAKPFSVGGVVVAPGGYDFQDYRTTYYLAPQHWLAGRLTFARGTFYDGDKTEVGYAGRLDVGSRIGFEPRLSINWVDLPGGRFTAKLVGARLGLTMSPRMALTSLLQYNSSRRVADVERTLPMGISARQRSFRRVQRWPRHALIRFFQPAKSIGRHQSHTAVSLVAPALAASRRGVLPRPLPRAACRRGLRFGASATKEVHHAVVPFVTRVLVEPILRLYQRKRCRPRSRPGFRIMGRELVVDRIRIDAREPFDQTQGVPRSPEVRPIGEIRRLDHQGIALPAAA